MTDWPVIVGDCIEGMAGMAADSIDAIVTDPPYLIGFMGKDFDRQNGAHSDGQKMQDWHRRWAEAAFRVLKPGGHMLVAGIGRTHHRMMCGVEDAVFEVRDTIWHMGVLLHVFGSGFPKGSRVNRDPRFCQCAVVGHSESSTDHELLLDDRIDMELAVDDDGLRKTNARHSIRKAEDSQDDYQPNLDLCGESALQNEADDPELAPSPRYAPRHTRSAAPSDGSDDESLHSPSQARYSDHPSSLDYSRLVPAAAITQIGTDGNTLLLHKIDSDSGSQGSRRPSKAESLSDVSPLDSPPIQEFSTGFPRCQICGKPNADGWNVALKPAVEVWALFRKPISERNVAANVLRWGTGALNIDATRVAYQKEQPPDLEHWKKTSGGWKNTSTAGVVPNDNSKGRWPPNLCLSHSPDCERVGTRRVKGQVGRPNSIGKQYHSNLYGDGICRMKPIADADGMETVADWRCAEGCAILALDRQVSGVAFIRSSEYNAVSGGAACGEESEMKATESKGNIYTGEIQGVANSIANSITDGSGNNKMAPFHQASMFTTPTGIPSTMNSPIYNSLANKNIDDYTMDSAEIPSNDETEMSSNDDAPCANDGFQSHASPLITGENPGNPIVANVVLRHSKHGGNPTSNMPKNIDGDTTRNTTFPKGSPHTPTQEAPIIEGGPSRYFPQFAFEAADFWPFRYVAKASRAERNEGLQNPGARRKRNDTTGGKYAEAPNPVGSNLHPTVKPVALMRWLLTLVTPPGGLVLDPFAGSGSTLVAAKQLGIRCVGIEQDAHYAEIAEQRIAATQAALVEETV